MFFTGVKPRSGFIRVNRPIGPPVPLVFNWTDLKTVPHKDIIGPYLVKALYWDQGIKYFYLSNNFFSISDGAKVSATS